MAANKIGKKSRKRMWVLFGILFLASSLAIRMLYPPHPRNWHKLKRGMARTEVLGMIENSQLELLQREITAPISSPNETWVKHYRFGKWTIRCLYDREGEIYRLHLVHIFGNNYTKFFDKNTGLYKSRLDSI